MYMKNKRILLIVCIIVLTIMHGCTKDDLNPDTSKYTVYVAGQYDGYRWIGCYWKNGERTDFNPDGNGMTAMVTGMSVSNGNVYVSGYYHTNENWVDVPCYWKNGVKTDLPCESDNPPTTPHYRVSYAMDIFASGNDVYTAGRYNVGDDFPYQVRVQPCYWKNTDRIDIIDYPDRYAELTSIYASNGDVYIGGKYDVPAGGGMPLDETQACYWKNGVKTDLPGSKSKVTGIFVENGIVYASGEYNLNFGGVGTPCYWVDGQKFDLPTGNATMTYTKAIFVANGTVYTAGYCFVDDYAHACFWKDNQQTTMERRSTASSIYVKDGIVFTCGSFSENRTNDNKYQRFPCYWANTKRTELPVTGDLRDTDFNDAVGIFVE